MSLASYPSEILNRLKWKEGESLEDAEIIIVHRGVPGERRTVQGKDVRSVGHLFFDTEETSIPMHRIVEIWYRGEKIFDRAESKRKGKTGDKGV